jgi:hypothetical protein
VQHRQRPEADAGAHRPAHRDPSAIAGSTRLASARAYSALAEYHWSRSPGATSATRWRGSAPAAICAAQ